MIDREPRWAGKRVSFRAFCREFCRDDDPEATARRQTLQHIREKVHSGAIRGAALLQWKGSGAAPHGLRVWRGWGPGGGWPNREVFFREWPVASGYHPVLWFDLERSIPRRLADRARAFSEPCVLWRRGLPWAPPRGRWAVSLERDARDLWCGLYWDRRGDGFHLWVCLIPCFPLHFHRSVSSRL